MAMTHIPIVRPVFPALERFSSRFAAALEFGQVTNQGRWVLEFERELTDFLGVPTLAFCNGQSALMAMLAAAGVRGGEVIVPSFTFPATPAAVVWAGAKPVFAEIRPDTLTLDATSVSEKLIRTAATAVLAVDPYGICADYKALAKLCWTNGAKFLVDSCAAFGSRVEGKFCAIADVQVFSFHATKSFSTMEGGALCSRDPEILERAARIRNFGQERITGEVVEPGINGKMTEVAALVGLAGIQDWRETRAPARQNRALALATALRGIPGLTVVPAPLGQEPLWLYRPVLIDPDKFGTDRDAVYNGLRERGIGARKYYGACHRTPAFRTYPAIHLPNTERIADQVIALPAHESLTDDDIAYIVLAFRDMQRGL